MTEAAVVTALLIEAVVFVAALAIFGALAAVLRTRAALGTRRGRAEQRARDEAAAAARIVRRLEDIAPGRSAQAPRAAPALAALASAAGGSRGRRRGRITILATGVLLVLLAVAGAVVLTPRAVPGGVLGVRGVPATSLPSGPGTAGYAITPGPEAPSPLATSAVRTAKAPSPTPEPDAGSAQASGARLGTTGPCGAAGCVVYVVRSGDTLGRIAGRFGVSILAILAVNPQLRDPNLIVTGQTLLLPSPTR